MKRWVLALVAIIAINWGQAAQAGGSWSIGYSDYSRHGGYSLAFGNWGSAISFASGWGYPSYGYAGYRAPYYGGCYYGCGYGYRGGYYAPSYSGYYAPRHYGGYYAPRYYAPRYYAPRHYGYYAPRYGYNHYRYSNRNYGRHDRYDHRRHDRYDGRSYRQSYKDHDSRGARPQYARYERGDGYGRDQSAYSRARDDGREFRHEGSRDRRYYD